MAYAPKQSLKEGFEKFVIKNKEGCWDWKGCCPKNPGYGQFRSNMKIEKAHRASWIIHFGEIPKGMFVCHKCDNKRCSNPEHLFLGSNKDNNLDMIKKKIHPTLGKKGEENHMSKLTEKQVNEIRQELKKRDDISKKEIMKNKLSQKNLAEKFGITQTLISAIKTNKIWKIEA
jgi:predicted XRE-type DNA-binding protein